MIGINCGESSPNNDFSYLVRINSGQLVTTHYAPIFHYICSCFLSLVDTKCFPTVTRFIFDVCCQMLKTQYTLNVCIRKVIIKFMEILSQPNYNLNQLKPQPQLRWVLTIALLQNTTYPTPPHRTNTTTGTGSENSTFIDQII